MSRKILVSIIFVSLFMVGMMAGMMPQQAFAADIYEPQPEIHGVLTKDILNLSDVFAYETDNNQNTTLPYSVENNISIDMWNIEYEKQFENYSLTTITTASGFTAESALLRDSNYIRYGLLKITNNTALAADTWYTAFFGNTLDVQVKNSYYILASAKIAKIAGTNYKTITTINYYFYDDNLNSFLISINFKDADVADINIGYTTYLYADINATKYSTVQFKLQDLLDTAGLGYTLTKLYKVEYKVQVKTASTVTDASVIASGQFRAARILSVPAKIENKMINGTTITFPAEKSIDTTVPLVKIANIQTSFKYLPGIITKTWNDKEFLISYSWTVTIPNDTGLSFSDVYMNFTVPSGEVQQLLVNGEDYRDAVKDKNAGNTVTLLNSMSAGSYMISCTVKYSSSDYDAIIAVEEAPYFNILDPSSWHNFGAWVTYSIYNTIQTIAAALGLSGTALWALAHKRAAKTESFK